MSLSSKAAGVIGAALLALGLAHILYLRFLYDDAFITFRYAENFARGLGLVYNAGERVEGYSNFLWTLLMSGVIAAGGRPEASSLVLGAGFALATLLLVLLAARGRGLDSSQAGVLLAANSGWATWATGGLETAMFTAFLTAGAILLGFGLGADPGEDPRAIVAPGSPRGRRPLRAFLLSAVAFGLASLTRPDGLLPTCCAAIVVVVLALKRQIAARHAAAWLAVVLGCVAPHLLWRLSYYGHLFPNTLAVKTPGLDRLGYGIAYLWRAFLDLNLYLLALPIALAALLRLRWLGLRRLDLVLIASILGPYLVYLASTGGDFMPAYRYVAPILPLVALAAAAAVGSLGEALGARAGRGVARVAVWGLLALYTALNLRHSRLEQKVWVRGEVVSVGWARREMDEWTRIGDLLRRIALPTDTLATTAGGAIPYRSGLYTIDLHGINAPDLSRYRRRSSERPGHMLYLDERWLDQRPPQILLGHPLVHPTAASLALGLDLRPEWHDRVLSHYELVGLTLMGRPTRFVGCGLRRDVADRILEAGRRLRSQGP